MTSVFFFFLLVSEKKEGSDVYENEKKVKTPAVNTPHGKGGKKGEQGKEVNSWSYHPLTP